MRPKTPHHARGPACSLCDIIQLGYFHQVNLLISRGMDINARDRFGRTPLILCAFMQPQEWGVGTAMTLIEHGAYVGEKDFFGRNVLHYACMYERETLIRVLLGAIDFDLCEADNVGNTVLHYATMSGNVTVTQLLVETFTKYRIQTNRVNRQGRTAHNEALTCGNTACAHVIALSQSSGQQQLDDSSVHVMEQPSVGSHSSKAGPDLHKGISPRQTSSSSSSAAAAAAVGKRAWSSPMVSIHQRQTLPLSVDRRPQTSFQPGVSRKAQNPLVTNSYRRDEDIIRCAPNGDFRNQPDYVCKLVHLPYETRCWGQGSSPDLASRYKAWPDTSNGRQVQEEGRGWRHELRKLFKVYEHQCSASWRASQQLDKPEPAMTPTPPAAEDEDSRGRKVRAGANLSRTGLGKDGSPDSRKRMYTARSRRSTNGKLCGAASLEGSLDTSSESITSLVSGRRRAETSLGRSESLVTKARTKSARGTHSGLQSPASSSSPLPSPAAFRGSPSAVDTTAQIVNNGQHLIPPHNSNNNSNQATATTTAQVNVSTAPSPSPTHKMPLVDTSKATTSQSASSNVPLVDTSKATTSQSASSNVPLVDTSKATTSQSASSNVPLKDDVAVRLPKITVVHETHTRGDQRDRDTNFLQQVDTNKLWVQHPYDNNNNNSDNNNNSNDINSDLEEEGCLQ